VSGQQPQAGLAEQSRGGTGGRARARSRAVLVVAEVALACMLMVAASLLLRSFGRLLDVDVGFTPPRAVAMRVEIPGESDANARAVLLDELTRRVADTPGIDAAGLTDALPLGRNRGWDVRPVGQVARESDFAFVYVVGAGYFDAMGIPVVAGRGFSDLDRGIDEPLVVVNQTLAGAYWPGEDATGRRIDVNGRTHRVLGVAADVRQTSLESAPGNQIYLAYWQWPPAPSVDLIVRSDTPADALAPLLRSTAGTLHRSERARALLHPVSTARAEPSDVEPRHRSRKTRRSPNL